jgi:RNA polymerase sigma-70 factor (ECF subfamily)
MNDEFAAMVAAVAEQRDREAFTALFDHFAPRIHGYLLKMGADPTASEEITQEVMTVLWHKARLFDPAKSSVATWLYRIARNRRIDGFRRDRIDYFDPLDPPEIASEEAAQDDALDARDRAERVRAAMEALPDEQLTLVRLAFYDGLSHSEVAERTGLPLGTVKSRLRLAFGRLRRTLEAGGVANAG